MESRRRGRSTGSRASATAAILLLGFVLAGCTDIVFDESQPSATTPPTDSPSIAPIAETEPQFVTVPDGTIVGTGTFESDRYDVSGSLEIVSEPDTRVGAMTFGWRVRLVDVVLPEKIDHKNQIRFVAQPYSGTWPCVGSWSGLDVVQWNAEQDEGVLASPAWPAATDPSYLDSLVILDEPGDPDENGCRFPVAARVDIAWTMPEVRPGLAVVAGDVLPNAAGAIAVEDGVPVSYTVASRDTLDAVARRLGITPDDLLFLNPARQNDTSTQRSELVAGERLNLVLSRR